MSKSSPLFLSRRAVLIQGLAAAMIDRFDQRLDFRTTQFSALENVLLGHQLSAEIRPTGKPVLSGYISSYFGERMDPFNGEEAFHKGLDFASDAGTDVLAVGLGNPGTEYAGTGPYTYNHAEGVYRCICCSTALYDSKTKYDSGTGWPSFWQPISAHNVFTKTDRSFGDVRDAIACRLCDAHLGHVFPDGPRPTGLRYCMNSVALNFVARA